MTFCMIFYQTLDIALYLTFYLLIYHLLIDLHDFSSNILFDYLLLSILHK